jgi:hypothetical protein
MGATLSDRQVNRTYGLQLGHAPRSESCNLDIEDTRPNHQSAVSAAGFHQRESGQLDPGGRRIDRRKGSELFQESIFDKIHE